MNGTLEKVGRGAVRRGPAEKVSREVRPAPDRYRNPLGRFRIVRSADCAACGACAAVCPTGATTFGRRADLLDEARARIKKEPGRYVDHVYGEKEVGGTSVLLLAGVAFDRLGYRTDLPTTPLPALSWRVMSQVPKFVVAAGVVLGGIHWITRRREDVAAAEGRETEDDR